MANHPSTSSYTDLIGRLMMDPISVEVELEAAEAIQQLIMKASAWRPIATAPKDATHIIVAVTGGPHGSTVCEAYWHPGDDGWNADWWLGASSPEHYYSSPISDIMHGAVTHWMPLPEAPL